MQNPLHSLPEEKGIFFNYQHSDFKLTDDIVWKEWITNCFSLTSKSVVRLDYIFCTDEFLLGINKSYLDHDFYTDIITFPLNDEPVHGELYISIDRVTENANNLAISFNDELRRVIAHGLLHLFGFDDKTDEDKLAMQEKESECLGLWHQNSK